MDGNTTEERKVIYVADPPRIRHPMRFMDNWAQANLPPDQVPSCGPLRAPSADDLIKYMSVFYHGFTVSRSPTVRAIHGFGQR